MWATQNCHTTSTLGQEMLQLIEKLQFFSLYLFAYFFGTNYNIGELTSATSNKRMTTNNIFAGATLIN